MKYIVDEKDLSQILWLLFHHQMTKKEKTIEFGGQLFAEWLCSTLRGVWITVVVFGFFLSNITFLIVGMGFLLAQILLHIGIKRNREKFTEPPKYEEEVSSTSDVNTSS